MSRYVPSLLLLLPALAHAHTGAGATAGFLHGLQHPFGGLDHALAMLAVGIWATQRGGRATWLVPATFVAMVGVGGAIGAAGVQVPFVELGILASVVALGALVIASVKLPLGASAAIVVPFALFHGLAHGAEMPAGASGWAYGSGFLLGAALLHGLGAGTVLLSRSFRRIAWR
jgi:urease accessory protein